MHNRIRIAAGIAVLAAWRGIPEANAADQCGYMVIQVEYCEPDPVIACSGKMPAYCGVPTSARCGYSPLGLVLECVYADP